MARHVERLDGGLWTAADPAFLKEGQLAFTQNLVYLPGSSALQRARGRSSFGSATGAASVDGLRDIEFDNGTHLLVAMVSGLYRYATVGDTGTFATLTSITQGDQLERIQFRNRYFLLNGVTADASATGTNFVVYLTATGTSVPTARQHGLLPVVAAPFASSTAGSFSQTVTGYYEYWTTEVAKITQDGADLILESAFAGEAAPTTVFVSSTGMYPIIHRPPLRNTLTTHWRVYRSPKKDAQSEKKFPTGFLISTDLGTATAQFPDTLTVASASSFPANFNSGSEPYSGWTTSATLSADNAVYASASAGADLTGGYQGVYGFNLGGFSGSVRGVAVEFQAYRSGGSGVVPVTVAIGRRDTDGDFTRRIHHIGGPFGSVKVPVFAAKSANVSASASGSPQTVTVGASADRWFGSDQLSLNDSDFGTDFMVVLYTTQVGVTLGVDYVKAYAYYAAAVDSTIVYPSVVYTFGDIVSQVSKNHPPPNASTGDIFEDSLVLNDTSNPALIRWSSPGEPEYFPPTYFLDFETNENDQVRLVKVVNSTLVVMLDSSAWRINYLPSERDASFDRGKATQPISKTYGCVNPMCAATFSMDGVPEQLAFVSNSGIHATDGYSFVTYTDGLNWRNVISATSTSTPICLINDRERQELLFYYRNDANGNETYLCLHLSYASEHLVNGKPKVSGPVHMRNFESGANGYASLESAWAIQRSTGATDIYLGYGGASAAAGAGHVYRETGTSIPANDSTGKWVSRGMYLAGFGNEWVGNEIYGYCGSYTGNPIISYVAQNAKTNDAGPTTVFTKSITLGGQKLHKVSPRATFERMQVTATITASAFAQEMFVVEGENFGAEDSGR